MDVYRWFYRRMLEVMQSTRLARIQGRRVPVIGISVGPATHDSAPAPYSVAVLVKPKEWSRTEEQSASDWQTCHNASIGCSTKMLG
jgi:hypothetical protein